MNFFKNFTFKTKLITLCVMINLVSVVVGLVSFVGLSKVEHAYGPVTQTSMPNLELANRMLSTFREIRINLGSLGLPGLTMEEQENYIKHVKENIEKYEVDAAANEAMPYLEGEEEIWKNVKTAWTNFKGVGARVLELNAKATPEAKQEMLTIFSKDCPEAAAAYQAALLPFLEFHKEHAHKFVANAEEQGRKINWINASVLFFGTVIGLMIGFMFASRTSKFMIHITEQLEKTTKNVNSTSDEIAHSSQSLSQATTEQAASLEETAASLEEITAMISKSAENAGAAAVSSLESHAKAEQGRAAVDQMMNSMEDISQSNNEIMNQVNHSNEQMTEIVKVIQEIGEKTKVINDIVFQTKLLSFNASVEAARAGEHGKGFAVVAEEVGNLAQMSGNAAKEISEMLQTSMKKVENIVQESKTKVETLIENGKEKVEVGVNTAKICADALSEIVANISKVSDLAQEISSASKEQSQGVGEINKAMGQLDTVTQQNASTSQDAAGSAEVLSKEAVVLNNAVSELIQTVYGAKKSNKNNQIYKAEDANKFLASSAKTNVIQFDTLKSEKPSADLKLKKAAGDDTIPDRNHSGFQDF